MVVENLGDTPQNLNADGRRADGVYEMNKAIITRALLVEVLDALENPAAGGLRKLSEAAVAAAKALTSSATADDAVAKAVAVETAITSTDQAAVVPTAMQALVTFLPDTGRFPSAGIFLTAQDVANYKTAAEEVQTLVDELKKLADDAVAAAAAVQ